MDNEIFFKHKFGDVYIPDNSEDESDYYDWTHFENTVSDFWNNNESQLVEKGFDNVDLFINHIISDLDWQFPETLMDEQLYFD